MFDSIKNFESLFREIRKIQEEITAQRTTGATKSSKQAFQHADREEVSTSSTDLQKELQTITRTMERLEQKIDNNSKSFQQLNNRVFQLENNLQRQQNVYSNRDSFTRGRFNKSYRGFGREQGQGQDMGHYKTNQGVQN